MLRRPHPISLTGVPSIDSSDVRTPPAAARGNAYQSSRVTCHGARGLLPLVVALVTFFCVWQAFGGRKDSRFGALDSTGSSKTSLEGVAPLIQSNQSIDPVVAPDVLLFNKNHRNSANVTVMSARRHQHELDVPRREDDDRAFRDRRARLLRSAVRGRYQRVEPVGRGPLDRHATMDANHGEKISHDDLNGNGYPSRHRGGREIADDDNVRDGDRRHVAVDRENAVLRRREPDSDRQRQAQRHHAHTGDHDADNGDGGRGTTGTDHLGHYRRSKDDVDPLPLQRHDTRHEVRIHRHGDIRKDGSGNDDVEPARSPRKVDDVDQRLVRGRVESAQEPSTPRSRASPRSHVGAHNHHTPSPFGNVVALKNATFNLSRIGDSRCWPAVCYLLATAGAVVAWPAGSSAPLLAASPSATPIERCTPTLSSSHVDRGAIEAEMKRRVMAVNRTTGGDGIEWSLDFSACNTSSSRVWDALFIEVTSHETGSSRVGELVSKLDLGNNGLMTLPSALHASFPYLRVLFASANRIGHVPSTVHSLRYLTHLSLKSNEIRTVDAAVSLPVHSLVHLMLTDNNISRIHGLGRLRKLRKLMLARNKIETLAAVFKPYCDAYENEAPRVHTGAGRRGYHHGVGHDSNEPAARTDRHAPRFEAKRSLLSSVAEPDDEQTDERRRRRDKSRRDKHAPHDDLRQDAHNHHGRDPEEKKDADAPARHSQFHHRHERKERDDGGAGYDAAAHRVVPEKHHHRSNGGGDSVPVLHDHHDDGVGRPQVGRAPERRHIARHHAADDGHDDDDDGGTVEPGGGGGPVAPHHHAGSSRHHPDGQRRHDEDNRAEGPADLARDRDRIHDARSTGNAKRTNAHGAMAAAETDVKQHEAERPPQHHHVSLHRHSPLGSSSDGGKAGDKAAPPGIGCSVMESLELVRLSGNRIADVSVADASYLAMLPNLTWFSMGGNPVFDVMAARRVVQCPTELAYDNTTLSIAVERLRDAGRPLNASVSSILAAASTAWQKVDLKDELDGSLRRHLMTHVALAARRRTAASNSTSMFIPIQELLPGPGGFAILGRGTSGAVRKALWRSTTSSRQDGGAAVRLPPSTTTAVAVKRYNDVSSDGFPADEIATLILLPKSDNILGPVALVTADANSSSRSGGPDQSAAVCSDSANTSSRRDLSTRTPCVVFPLMASRPLGQPPTLQTVTMDTFDRAGSSAAPLIASTRSACQIAEGAAAAMSALHEQHIIHGDFYAHNIFTEETAIATSTLSSSARRLTTRVSDFGAAFAMPPRCSSNSTAAAPPSESEALLAHVVELSKAFDVRALGVFILDVLSISPIATSSVDRALDTAMRDVAARCMGPLKQRPSAALVWESLKAGLST